MKWVGLLLIVLLIITAGLTATYIHYATFNASSNEFFFGVSFGQETVEEAKLLIDKVKSYTNLFLINSWTISTNETALNAVCEYAAEANLKFIVFFSWISRVMYRWHQTWLDTAEERWPDNFLGVYLFDEPGGKQIEIGGWNEGVARVFKNVSDYTEAANLFVNSISSVDSTQDVKDRGILMFTSDFALYWFDYLAGYDTVFVELGWNHSTPKHIALCRGAANVQGKEWGVIITWTYYEPPHLASGPEILEEMLTAYRAGAKYVIVFNYAEDPETGKPYCILEETHFEAMQEFWRHTQNNGDQHEKTVGQTAFVLPKDYGWGMRHLEDNIWGLWPADENTPLIWENMNKLVTEYGLELDIIYGDAGFNYHDKYSNVYLWNTTINACTRNYSALSFFSTTSVFTSITSYSLENSFLTIKRGV